MIFSIIITTIFEKKNLFAHFIERMNGFCVFEFIVRTDFVWIGFMEDLKTLK